MTIWRAIVLANALLLATAARAATYGDTLLAATASRYAGLVAISIHATTDKSRSIDLSWGDASKTTVQLPLRDALGRTIGIVSFGFYKHKQDGAAIAAEMARRIYVADNLAEADPFVPGARRLPYAQALVDQVIDANRDLVTLAMHVTPPGETSNVIVSSSFGRIGKAADADDIEVIGGATRKEVTNNGTRIAVELPQRDATGATIGALRTSFMLMPGETPENGTARAIAVRDWLAAATPDLASLSKENELTGARQRGVRMSH